MLRKLLLSSVFALSSFAVVQAQTIIPSYEVFSFAPNYNLANNALAVAQIFPLSGSSQIVPTNKQFNFIRTTQSNGSDTVFTLGTNSLVTGVYSTLTSGANSSATSNTYGAVLQATNAGPGVVKGMHTGCYGVGVSSGACIGVNSQIAPVATQGYSAAFFAPLTGANDIATAYAIEHGGSNERYQFGLAGGAINALPINQAYIFWQDSSSSSANAYFAQVRNPAGGDVFTITKSGVLTGKTIYTAVGSASNPTISFTNDKNTGIFSPGADNISITTGGVERGRINSIGTLSWGNPTGATMFSGGESAFFQRFISVGAPVTGPGFLLGDTGVGEAVIGGAFNHPTTIRSNNVDVIKFMPAKHIAPQGGTPTLTSCGSDPSISGTDTSGEVTMGTAATGCVITFNIAYNAAPYCVVTWQATPMASQSYVVSPTAITTTQTSTSGNKLNYMCLARATG